jgi:hypothetical protein
MICPVLGGYQFGNQGISYLLTLLYTFHYNQYFKAYSGELFVKMLLYLFYLDLGQAC